jgi:hypothetical protein
MLQSLSPGHQSGGNKFGSFDEPQTSPISQSGNATYFNFEE